MERTLFTLTAICTLGSPAHALDGGALRIQTVNGWKAFEVISQNDDPLADGPGYPLPGAFDGAGAFLLDTTTLRVQVNHENTSASISEIDIDLSALQTAISNMISAGTTGGGSFVEGARQAYDQWSADGGATWTPTTNSQSTAFSRFCSSQAYAPHTFGPNRGFGDELYITGEEVGGGRFFVVDSANRNLYQLSGIVGNAAGGNGGMPFDAWENAALVDTAETGHVALLLSPDGGSQNMQFYIGEKGKDVNGDASSSFLARNGLAYGSWYYLNSSLPDLDNTNAGSFDTSSADALSSDKLEDVDTSPSHPDRVVLGDQTSGVFTFDFDLVFGGGGFDAGASTFTITKISDTSGGTGSLNAPDNVDWTAATQLGSTSYPEGIVFVNEDNGSGEIWRLSPDGSDPLLVGSTTVGAESTGIFDLSEMVGYVPGSILIVNNQGTPSSMSVIIDPDAYLPEPGLAVGLFYSIALLAGLRRRAG